MEELGLKEKLQSFYKKKLKMSDRHGEIERKEALKNNVYFLLLLD